MYSVSIIDRRRAFDSYESLTRRVWLRGYPGLKCTENIPFFCRCCYSDYFSHQRSRSSSIHHRPPHPPQRGTDNGFYYQMTTNWKRWWRTSWRCDAGKGRQQSWLEPGGGLKSGGRRVWRRRSRKLYWITSIFQHRKQTGVSSLIIIVAIVNFSTSMWLVWWDGRGWQLFLDKREIYSPHSLAVNEFSAQMRVQIIHNVF